VADEVDYFDGQGLEGVGDCSGSEGEGIFLAGGGGGVDVEIEVR
jgi:hypothetical protein